jgi:hypothetical protein
MCERLTAVLRSGGPAFLPEAAPQHKRRFGKSAPPPDGVPAS